MFERVQYSPGDLVIRGTKNNNLVNITLQYLTGNYSIEPLTWEGHNNFNLTYAYHTTDISTYSEFEALSVRQGVLDLATAQV